MTSKGNGTKGRANRRAMCAILPTVLALVCSVTPVVAIVARPALLVGPPTPTTSLACLSFATPAGGTLGVSVPLAGLALGAATKRNGLAFYAGGGGTSGAVLAAQRRQAGVQWQPQIFDPAEKTRPSVFSANTPWASGPSAYQHLLLRASKSRVLPYGLIYAQPVSRQTGRIVSVGLTLPSKPAARPKVIISMTHARAAACPQFLPVAVYAPHMSAAQIRRLFTTGSCNWNSMKTCAVADRPRGRVLFVQQVRSGVGYEHRWVDYDLYGTG